MASPEPWMRQTTASMPSALVPLINPTTVRDALPVMERRIVSRRASACNPASTPAIRVSEIQLDDNGGDMGVPGRRKRFVLALVALASIAGCGTDLEYFVRIAAGEIESLGRTRPIDQVLADGSVTPEQADKLRFVLKIRAYARDRVGLNPGNAYTLYEDNANGPAAYAVSASRRDRLEPYRWTYPFIGAYDAKGFFDLDMAKAERARLESQGYDVFLGAVPGFSTLGILPDPVRASNLAMSDVDLAELVLHELTHNTIYKPDDSDFNESMAEFVGRTSALMYFRETFGVSSPEAQAAQNRMDDLGVIDDFVIELYARLSDYYAQPLSSDEKIAGRQAIFDEQQTRFTTVYSPRLTEPERYSHIADVALNNASVLAGTRYQSGLDTYAQVFEALDSDWPSMLDVLREAASKQDSRGFLREWLHQRR